ncbi:MAG: metallophosphoesterase, partial [Actinobacteria bacterium]|nr:metallophosphoesterase [Actinomycetota bacterium]
MRMPAALAATATAALLAACGMAQAPAINPLTPGFRRDGAGRAVDGQSVRDPARPRVQRIAILPDRTTGRDWGLPYLEAAVEDLNIVRPDAVFTVGDMVQGYTRDRERWEREVRGYLARVGRLVPAFYPTPGNHDVISGSRESGDRTFAECYRERFGPLWYSVELDLATAIVLFSDEGLGDGKIVLGDGQLAWLAGALDAAKARGKPIFL